MGMKSGSCSSACKPSPSIRPPHTVFSDSPSHVFVFVELASTPRPVESDLIRELDHLPDQSPDLPQPVTGVWIVSTMGQRGLRWNGDAWKLFDAHGEGIDS
jgi:hypothetical protein